MNKSVMVTGCAGFIGSHMVDLLLDSGYNVVGVDCFTYAGKVDNIKHQYDHENFTMVNMDICNTHDIKSWVDIRNIDWIINFAAESHVDNSIRSSEKFIHSNFRGVHSLLEVCKESRARLFQISTDEVYGSTTGDSLSEVDRLNPSNPYSATKAAAEHLITAYHNTFGTSFKMVRMSNNFGPRQDKEKFIPTIIRSLREKNKIPVYGDGSNVRDWMFVKDCCLMIKEVLEQGELNETYNISLKNELSNISLIEKITKIMNVPFRESITYVPDRLGHDFRYSINNSKFSAIRRLRPTDFTKALVETIASYT